MNLSLAHVLPPSIETARAIILKWIENNDLHDFRLLFLTQPASFLDPMKLQGERRNVCKRGTISIAIVRGNPRGRLVAGFVPIAISNQSGKVAALLREASVPVYTGSLTDKNAILKFLETVHHRPQLNQTTRTVINLSEYNVARLVKSALGVWWPDEWLKDRPQSDREIMKSMVVRRQKRFRVYEEVALGEIIGPLEGTQFEYLQAYRVDLLIAASPPDSTPLLVVEFDGPTHENKQKAQIDAERDSFLLENSLPVLRISCQNPMHLRAAKYLISDTGKFFSALITWLVKVMESKKKKEVSLKKRYTHIFATSMAEKIAEYRLKNAVIDIPEEVLDNLDAEVREEKWDALMDIELQLSDTPWDLREERESRVRPEYYGNLMQCVESGSDVKVRTNGEIETGLDVECSGFGNGQLGPIRMGPFFANVKSPEEFQIWFKQAAEMAAIQAVLDVADLTCSEFIDSQNEE